MARAGAAVGHDGLWIKRDDVMSLGLGGNKVRSLEYWLGEAATTGGDMLVVAGAPASNQCRLVAAAGARMGIETLVLYAGDEPGALGGNAMLTRLFGARIRWLGPVTEVERGRRAAQVVEELRAHGRRPYLIGNPVVAALGYVRAAQELAEQVGALDLRHVLLPGSFGPASPANVAGKKSPSGVDAEGRVAPWRAARRRGWRRLPGEASGITSACACADRGHRAGRRPAC
ncbi:D-cysteine desulfhydrase [Bosea thiooxidans]